jgi:serine/threonine protein kinase/tetratricopeptide (TPR) repeat protein
MICPHCHAGNAEQAQRCVKCGGVLQPVDPGETLIGPGPTASAAKPVAPKSDVGSGVLTPAPTPVPIDPSATLVGGSYVPAFGVGTTVGSRFVIEGLLGEGGMGRVYKAYDRELDRYVALKVLQPELARDPQIIQRFKHELLLASRISHKNILRIHDLSDASGLKFISMAFVEGQDLHHLLEKEGLLPPDRALKIARQLCEALAAAHAEGVVHRDFKPQNVLVAANDQVYVSDFGLATSIETAKLGMTRTGAFVGTPRYMSPEQVEGGKVDHRSDLYSLGLVIYELVTGDLPFTGESTWQLMYQRVKEKPKDPKTVRPELPDWISRIVLHCLERDPQNRYQSASEILADIDANRSPTIAAGTLLKRNPALKWGIVSAASAALLVGAFFAIPGARRLVIKAPSVSIVDKSGLPPLSKGKFVAILPFRVLGGDGSMNYVAEGINEALSSKLFQLNDVHIAAPSEAAKQNDQTTPLPRIAKELGVNMIVTGFVQIGADNEIRVTVGLQNMEENRLQWKQEFSGVTGDLLTIEDKIYQGLEGQLSVNPSDAALAAAIAHPTENVAAYNDYLKGRNAMNGTVDEKNIQAAINSFSSALQKDPGFALAYTGLADANLMLYQQKRDNYWAEKALDAAKRAESLNDRLPEVHSALGNVYSATGQIVRAIEEDKRALELAPNSDEAYRRLGNAYRANGQKAEALQALEKAVQINPYYWNNLAALGNAYLAFGEPDKAVKMYSQVIDLEPENPAGYSDLGMAYFSQAKYEDGIAAFQKALKIAPSADIYTNLGTAYFYLKRYPESLQMFEKAVQLNPEDGTLMGNLADGYRLAGNKEKAQATYEKAIMLAYKQLRGNPRDTQAMGQLALYYAKKGEPRQAADFVKKARAIDRQDVYLIYIAAVVDTIAGKQADAVKELNTALEKGFSVNDVEVEPEFAPLTSRSDYQALIKKFSQKKR